MFKTIRSKTPTILFAAAAGLAACVIAAPRSAGAQEIEPNEFVPLPAGTNLAIGYYDYGHENAYSIAKGPTYTHNTGAEVNIALARYVHYTTLLGQPAGFQILQPFGAESSVRVGGASLGNAFGAQNTILSAFFWPYANPKTGTNIITTAFLYPPDGTYDRTSSVNIGDHRWRGDAQLGFDQQIGSHFSATLAIEAMFYGENDDYTIYRFNLNSTPTYRFQAWANWRWSPAFQTALGYEGLFGGIESVEGTRDGNRTEEQRLRASASMFLSPRSQVLLEINHDVEAVGGFKQEVGAIARFLYVF